MTNYSDQILIKFERSSVVLHVTVRISMFVDRPIYLFILFICLIIYLFIYWFAYHIHTAGVRICRDKHLLCPKSIAHADNRIG